MSNAALIINHVHFPYRLFEQCLAWTKDNNATLKVIFLTHEQSTEEETQKIISQQMYAMEQQTDVHDLTIESKILLQPTLEEILEEVKEADKIFIEIQDEESLKNLSLSWNDLMAELGRNRQVVSNKAFGEA